MALVEHMDPRRLRQIPVAVYDPKTPPRALILFSVGFGGTCQGYAFLARAWCASGFRVVVVEHVGSNLKVLQQWHPRGAGQRHADLARWVGEKAREPQELLDRPQDLLFVASQYHDGLPLGLAGHSLGAYTVGAAAGCPVRLPPSGARVGWKNPLRPVGVILMSPQPPGHLLDPAGLGDWQCSTLVLTGTLDSGMPAGVDYRQRLQLFQHLPRGRASLALLEGADHMSFAGVGLKVKPVMTALQEITGRFWDRAFSPQGEEPDRPDAGGVRIYWNQEALCLP